MPSGLFIATIFGMASFVCSLVNECYLSSSYSLLAKIKERYVGRIALCAPCIFLFGGGTTFLVAFAMIVISGRSYYPLQRQISLVLVPIILLVPAAVLAYIVHVWRVLRKQASR